MRDPATVARDADGFLLDQADWDEDLAYGLAAEAGIMLTPAHWEVIHMLRRYFAAHELAPAMRALVNITRRELGADKGRSIYLLQLFPGKAALHASRIAGLPRPEHCF